MIGGSFRGRPARVGWRPARVGWQLPLGLAIVLAWLAIGVAAPLLTGVDPLKARSFLLLPDGRFLPAPFEPGEAGFPLGSDREGRDVWVNLMYGARSTLTIAGLVLAARLAIGTLLGGLAGWHAGRWVDRAISALIDAFAAFPTLLFAVVWIFAFDIRSGQSAFVAALAITGWWGFGRATRAGVVALRGRPFLEAARSTGLDDPALVVRHLAPNLLPALAITAALEASAILLLLGELGFLGYVVGGGTSIPLDDRGGARVFFFASPEWGAILAQGRLDLLRAPWLVLYPAAAFASTILAFTLVGHGLRGLVERSPLALHRLLTRKVGATLAIAVVAFRLVTPLVGPGAGYARIADTFDAERARAHVAFFADAARGGRLSGSPGYAEAARYVADRFAEVGLAPLGDGGGYLQRFRMSVVELAAPPLLERLGAAPKAYRPRVDFNERVGGRAGGGAAEGLVVYVGGGVRTAEYSDYEGTHPEGNLVMIAGPTQGDAVDIAIRQGAAGVILVADRQAAERTGTPELIRGSYLPRFEDRTLPVVTVTEAVADELIAASGKRIADLRHTLEERQRRARERPSLQRVVPEPLSFDTTERVRLAVPLGPVHQIETANVVGLLRGTDPARADKYVLVGGHLDGVGTAPDGTVFPAANDNASGPAVTIEIARALAAQRDRLRNSVIFFAFAGEEEGLVGSEAFASRSLTLDWRPQNVVALLNLDMPGCCGPLAASDESFELHARLAAAADRLGVPFGYTPRFGGSDHLTYVRRRVPAVMLARERTGPLHTTADTVDGVTVAALRDAGRVGAQFLLELAAGD